MHLLQSKSGTSVRILSCCENRLEELSTKTCRLVSPIATHCVVGVSLTRASGLLLHCHRLYQPHRRGTDGSVEASTPAASEVKESPIDEKRASPEDVAEEWVLAYAADDEAPEALLQLHALLRRKLDGLLQPAQSQRGGGSDSDEDEDLPVDASRALFLFAEAPDPSIPLPEVQQPLPEAPVVAAEVAAMMPSELLPIAVPAQLPIATETATEKAVGAETKVAAGHSLLSTALAAITRERAEQPQPEVAEPDPAAQFASVLPTPEHYHGHIAGVSLLSHAELKACAAQGVTQKPSNQELQVSLLATNDELLLLAPASGGIGFDVVCRHRLQALSGIVTGLHLQYARLQFEDAAVHTLLTRDKAVTLQLTQMVMAAQQLHSMAAVAASRAEGSALNMPRALGVSSEELDVTRRIQKEVTGQDVPIRLYALVWFAGKPFQAL